MRTGVCAAFLAMLCCGALRAETLTWQEANQRSAEALGQGSRKEAAAYARQAFDLYETQAKQYTIANHAQLLLNLVAIRARTTFLKEALKEYRLSIERMRKKAGRPDPSFVSLWEEGARIALAAIEMLVAHDYFEAAADEADELWGKNDPRAILIHSRWAYELRKSRGYFWAKGKLSDARERAATGRDKLLLFAIDLNLARLETEAERHESAIPLYRSLIERGEAEPQALPKETLQSLYAQLEYAYEETGDPKGAKEMRERLISTFGGQAQEELTAVFKVMPPHPRGGNGSVTVRVWVKADGTVRDVAVVSSTSSDFEEPCLEAVRRWKFQPRVVDGQPVEQEGVVKLIFRLKKNYWS